MTIFLMINGSCLLGLIFNVIPMQNKMYLYSIYLCNCCLISDQNFYSYFLNCSDGTSTYKHKYLLILWKKCPLFHRDLLSNNLLIPFHGYINYLFSFSRLDDNKRVLLVLLLIVFFVLKTNRYTMDSCFI
jgi:hypothetical protein